MMGGGIASLRGAPFFVLEERLRRSNPVFCQRAGLLRSVHIDKAVDMHLLAMTIETDIIYLQLIHMLGNQKSLSFCNANASTRSSTPAGYSVMSPARFLGAIMLLVCGVSEAAAHPHVMITARSDIIFAPDGSITGVRHAWTFDEMFSTYALQGVATAKKGVYTREELAPLALTNVDALKDFAYFTVAKSDGRKRKFGDPSDYYFERENDALTLYFTLPLRSPVMSRQFVLDIFDPSYFIAFSMDARHPVRLIGAPEKCSAALRPPSDDMAAAQKLSEDDFLNGDNGNYGALFANRITVACP